MAHSWPKHRSEDWLNPLLVSGTGEDPVAIQLDACAYDLHDEAQLLFAEQGSIVRTMPTWPTDLHAFADDLDAVVELELGEQPARHGL